MLVSIKEILADAKKNKYAVPAFDVSNYEMLKAVLETCEEEKSPALLMGLGVDLQGRDLNLLSAMVKGSAEFYNVPVCFHLDHATDFLMIPEYLSYKLTGVKKKEYTNASTAGILNAQKTEGGTQQQHW